MPTLDDVSRVASCLPGSEQRSMTGGEAWFVRNKLYAWEFHPWPSERPELRELMIAEPMVGVKVADYDEQRALLLYERWTATDVQPRMTWERMQT